jgi:K+-transporting ATPase c subunit
MSEHKRPTSSRIVALCIVLISGFGLCYTTKILFVAKNSISWPTTDGVIVSSTLKSKDGNRSIRGNSTRETYYADALYRYQVGNNENISNVIAIGDYTSSSNALHHQKIVKKYPTNSVVRVHYNAINPSQSVLEPGIRKEALYLPIACSVFFLSSIYILVTSERKNNT